MTAAWLPAGWLCDRWEMMLRIRRAEEAVAGMIESGEAACPCHLYIGQEAIAAGVCAALAREDSIWGGHRSHGHYLAKGGSLEALFAEILGRTSGCSAGRGGSMHLAAAELGILGTVPIVAATVPLAVGAAMAYKLRGEAHVAASFFGDGTLEEGHVHESMNLAALYRLPVIFVCENNLYASHMHWSERRVLDNLDRAGEFHGIPGQRIDGNCVAAVFDAVRPLVERARQGDGPSFIECRTFLWRGHVGASWDMDVGVERRGELIEWQARDPVRRAFDQLTASGIADLKERSAAIDQEIAAALDAARRGSAPSRERVSDFVYAEAACGL